LHGLRDQYASWRAGNAILGCAQQVHVVEVVKLQQVAILFAFFSAHVLVLMVEVSHATP